MGYTKYSNGACGIVFKIYCNIVYYIDSTCWFQEPKKPFPTIVVTVPSDADLLHPSNITIMADSQCVVRECVDIKQAITSLFAVYWLYNIEYPKVAQNFFRTLHFPRQSKR